MTVIRDWFWIPIVAVSLGAGLNQARLLGFSGARAPLGLPTGEGRWFPPEAAAQIHAEIGPEIDRLREGNRGLSRALQGARAHRRWLIHRSADLRDSVSQLQARVGALDAERERARQASQAVRRRFSGMARALLGRERLLSERLRALGRQGDSLGRERSRIAVEREELSSGWEALGMDAIQQGAFPPAQKALQQALLLRPEDPVLHYNLGILAQDYLGQPEEALRHYRRFLALAPGEEGAPRVREWVRALEEGSARGEARR